MSDIIRCQFCWHEAHPVGTRCNVIIDAIKHDGKRCKCKARLKWYEVILSTAAEILLAGKGGAD